MKFTVAFDGNDTIGLEISEASNQKIFVNGFGQSNVPFPAEACGKIRIGDIVAGVNDIKFEGMSVDEVMEHIRKAETPRVLHFQRSNSLISPRYSLEKRSSNLNNVVVKEC